MQSFRFKINNHLASCGNTSIYADQLLRSEVLSWLSSGVHRIEQRIFEILESNFSNNLLLLFFFFCLNSNLIKSWSTRFELKCQFVFN
ncbi:hypothetical protein HanIR_Chr16g0807371 [Helianthus annuus]|nr:hypothetical protein HanIR_Chr16g0807371 [Helianthus annuus]